MWAKQVDATSFIRPIQGVTTWFLKLVLEPTLLTVLMIFSPDYYFVLRLVNGPNLKKNGFNEILKSGVRPLKTRTQHKTITTRSI